MDVASNDIEQVDSTGSGCEIPSRPFERDIAAVDGKAGQAAIRSDIGDASRQRRMRRIDKAAAMHMVIPLGFATDDVGAATKDFGRTVERRAIAAGDFVEDDRSGAGAVEVRIAGRGATEVRRADFAFEVVEDQARRADIEVRSYLL